MKRWLENISYNLAGKIAAMVFLLLLDIVSARILKVDAYAEWIFFFSILTMLFWVGWLGINTSTKIYLSKELDIQAKADCVKSAAVLRFFVSFVISSLICIIMPKLAGEFGYPGKYPGLLSLFYFAPLLVFFNGFTEFFKQNFIGETKFKYLFVITAIEYMGYFCFSFIGLVLSRNVLSMAVGYLVSGLAVSIVGWYLIKKIHGNYLANAHVCFRKYMLPIFKYAIPIALISMGGMILVEMDTFMIGMLSTKENVAVYSIAKNLSSKAAHLNLSLTTAVMTTFSVISVSNYKKLRSEFFKAEKFIFFITIVVVTGFLILGDFAISILYGAEYNAAGFIIRQLTVYYSLYGISNFYSVFLDFRNKAGARSLWYASVVIINLVLNYIWIPRYGAIGAAWATDLSLVPYTIYAFIASRNEWKNLREHGDQTNVYIV